MKESGRLPGWGVGARLPANVVETRQAPPREADAGTSQLSEAGWTLVGRAGKAVRPGRIAFENESADGTQASGAVSIDTCSRSDSRRRGGRNALDSFARTLSAVSSDDELVSPIIAALAERWPLQPVSSIILLGVGSPTTSAPSRHQLAFSILLSTRLGLKGCQVFDPVFDGDDMELLRAHKCKVLTPEESQAAHRCCVGQRVLFIMPHCELELYDAVLAANWDAARLAAIAIIGNSFRNYLESNLQRTRRLGRRVSWIQEHTREQKISASSAHPISTFNNMSLHFFDIPETLTLEDIGALQLS